MILFEKHKKLIGLFHQLDALCPAVEELKKLVTPPPGGYMAVLQTAAQVQTACVVFAEINFSSFLMGCLHYLSS